MEGVYNLPNAITAARILVAPLIAWLPFQESPWLRLLAFVLFIVAAVTDYFDGQLARSRNMVTAVGQLLDPLADKLLLLATFIPMFALMSPLGDALGAALGIGASDERFFFATMLGAVALPWWIVATVLGRELFMTIFRQVAAARGVIIAAIGPAKWKTGFQSTWVGAAYFWFFAASLPQVRDKSSAFWGAVPLIVGTVGAFTMVVAVLLTLYSLALYITRYGRSIAR